MIKIKKGGTMAIMHVGGVSRTEVRMGKEINLGQVIKLRKQISTNS